MKSRFVVVPFAALAFACSMGAWTTTQKFRLPTRIVDHRGSPLVVVVTGTELQVMHHDEEETAKGISPTPTFIRTWTARELNVRTCTAGPAREYKEDPVARSGVVSPSDASASLVFGAFEYYADPNEPENLMALDRTTGRRLIVARNLGVIYSVTSVPEARRIVIVVNSSSIIRVFDVDTRRVTRCL